MSFLLTTNSVLDWLKAAFAVQSIKGSEVNFFCPICGHARFYFNWRKLVGFCHRASCGVKPTLADLVDLKGYGPDDYYSVSTAQEPVAEKPKVELPAGSWEVNDITDPWLVKALEYRGVTIDKCAQFELRALANRVFIPIYQGGELVQTIGRAIDRCKLPGFGFQTDHASRFQYAKGAFISNFIFQWDIVKEWEEICLVESTFNAMAWIDKFNCTTNFGSHLSASQLSLLQHSRAKRVVLAWDQDALRKAYEAAAKLTAIGIKPAIISFQYRQPDDAPFDNLKSAIERAFKELKNAPQYYGPLRVGV